MTIITTKPIGLTGPALAMEWLSGLSVEARKRSPRARRFIVTMKAIVEAIKAKDKNAIAIAKFWETSDIKEIEFPA